ncbi:hypothetical protein OC844_008023, partial [Tilletia horrida]
MPALSRAEVPLGPRAPARPLPAPPAPAPQASRFSPLTGADFDAAVNAAVGMDSDSGSVRWSDVMEDEEAEARAAGLTSGTDSDDELETERVLGRRQQGADKTSAATSTGMFSASPRGSSRARNSALTPSVAVAVRTSPRFIGTPHSAEARQAAAALAQSQGVAQDARASPSGATDASAASAIPPSAQPPAHGARGQASLPTGRQEGGLSSTRAERNRGVDIGNAELHELRAMGTAGECPQVSATQRITAAREAMRQADHNRQAAAQARTKAYASLMGAMETMCAAGHMDASELDLVLAATKA